MMLHPGTSLRCVVPRIKFLTITSGLHPSQRSITTTQGKITPYQDLHKHSVSTLRRESLTSQDYLDLSNLLSVDLHIPQEASELGQSTLGLPDRGLPRLMYFNRGMNNLPFPDGTRGFLYYFVPPFAPPIAGQIRFRITPSQDPSSFSSGYDLRNPITTLPISWSLRRLLSSCERRRLASLLLHDGLVTNELLGDTVEMVRTEDTRSRAASLYALGQPFYLDLQTGISSFDILAFVDGKNVAERAEVTFPSTSVYNLCHKKYPYTGSALCCFVRPTPDRISIRVLKILQEVRTTYPDPEIEKEFALPQEGQLLPTRHRPWSYRIPTKKAFIRRLADRRRPLRLLQECPGATWDMI